MKIEKISSQLHSFSLVSGERRCSLIIYLIDEERKEGWGECAPLPKWSKETLNDSIEQLSQKLGQILLMEWTLVNYLQNLLFLNLWPSLSFGLESALLFILSPLTSFATRTSALLMGRPDEILEQAAKRRREGFLSAKLKVSNLNFQEATDVIHRLKNEFYLRIDVNRAWSVEQSLHFFSQFPLDAFDYVEEPFDDPHALSKFTHPLAVDESFPTLLSLKELESIPQLKSLIYKPTIQGGWLSCAPLTAWSKEKNVDLVLSSSFESSFGLAQIAALAWRFSLSAPIGMGTYHFLKREEDSLPMHFSRGWVSFPDPSPYFLEIYNKSFG